MAGADDDRTGESWSWIDSLGKPLKEAGQQLGAERVEQDAAPSIYRRAADWLRRRRQRS